MDEEKDSDKEQEQTDEEGTPVPEEKEEETQKQDERDVNFEAELNIIKNRFDARSEVIAKVFPPDDVAPASMIADISNYTRLIEELSRLMGTDPARLTTLYKQVLGAGGMDDDEEDEEEEDEYELFDPATQSPIGPPVTPPEASEFIAEEDGEEYEEVPEEDEDEDVPSDNVAT